MPDALQQQNKFVGT